MSTITHAKVSSKSDGGDSSLILPSDWNADHTIADGYILPRVITANLNDGDIKALPSGGLYEVIPTPGMNQLIYIIGGVWKLDTTAGAYDPPAADSVFQLIYGNNLGIASSKSLANSMATASLYVGTFIPYGQFNVTFDPDLNTYSLPSNEIVGQSVSISEVWTGAAGFTGGNAANTLTIQLIYHIFDV